MAQQEEPTRTFRDIAVLLSAASIITDSPSLIDRMANCLSPEPAVRAVTDALRIIDSDQNAEKPQLKTAIDERGYTYLLIEDKHDRKHRINGRLPSGETVRKFLEEVYMDIATARKIGTLASALTVESKLRIEQTQTTEEGG